jgi:predicted metalloprotease
VTIRRRAIGITGLMAALIAVSACAADQGVVTVAAQDDTASADPTETTLTPVPDDSEAPGTTAAPATDPAEPDAPATMPTATVAETELLTEIPIADVVDVDENKPERSYDQFVAVAFTDIERWWSEQYPAVYGEPFEPLTGGIYAGYPERQTELPGCGEARTDYQDLQQFVAFYCALSDFMMYDDGDNSLLAPLTSEFGPSVMGVVLAHEYGHAIQKRIGALDQFTATIYTEQQADCFAGAWVGQAYRGESPLLRLSDADVRAGLVAMLSVRDPVGTNQFVEGGHGSAFDRVGAFQEGFLNGAARCAELLDAPLTLMPNEFQDLTDFEREGNASYDCSDDPSENCRPAYEFLGEDLNDFWATALGDFPPLTGTPASDISEVECADGVRIDVDVLLCPSTGQVAYDEGDVVDLYRDFGDFTLGYLYGIAWAERAQQVQGSELTGEARALRNDCYVGAWVANITPDAEGNIPRQRDTDGDGVLDGVRSSPGDLDEAIRMAIFVGDPAANDNVVGSPFEKIASFRTGVLGGVDACEELLED